MLRGDSGCWEEDAHRFFQCLKVCIVLQRPCRLLPHRHREDLDMGRVYRGVDLPARRGARPQCPNGPAVLHLPLATRLDPDPAGNRDR